MTPSQPLREQGPDSASLSGGGTGMLPAAIVRDGELRLSDATPAPTNEGALATNSPEVKPAQQPATKPDSKPAAEDRWHTVANGDSAYSIAKRYYGNGEAWKALAKYNKDRIGTNGAVRVGVRVRIPEASVLGLKVASKTDSKTEPKADARAVERSLIAKPVAKPDAKPEAKPTAKPEASKPEAAKAPAKKGNTYTVKAGDSLARIAQQQLGTTKRMQEILKLNPGIKDADDIRAGMTLQMPAK
jgi:nucleoid-associated protein YgaU